MSDAPAWGSLEPRDDGRTLDDLLAEAVTAADPGIGDRIATDPGAHLELVALTARASTSAESLLATAVSSARSAGHSWEAIGTTLGISRQAAQQRFGRPVGPGAPGTVQDLVGGAEVGDTRILSPVTAVTEMAALAAYGRKGWRSTGFGAGFHRLVRTTTQWEHQRVYVLGASRFGLEADGWERIGTLFPWVYYVRSLGVAPVGGDGGVGDGPHAVGGPRLVGDGA
ncbi:hypothetical protein [Oerskovia sp. KBS0722]|uniref:hypothetical protein n=1 Tax=Oerskovia sp. KBS0722 TaxID=1179673 RepID=UPI001AEFB45F|nr:hypothetical protein [Oerskovia sp. KBS0722]